MHQYIIYYIIKRKKTIKSTLQKKKLMKAIGKMALYYSNVIYITTTSTIDYNLDIYF